MGNNHLYFGIDIDKIKSIYTSQENASWCWAASIQVVLKYYGVDVSQKDIVSKIFSRYDNNKIDMSLDNATITDLLNNKIKELDICATINSFANSKNKILCELHQNRPVLLSYLLNENIAHIVVVFGMVCNNNEIIQINFLDPDDEKKEKFGICKFVGQNEVDNFFNPNFFNAFWTIKIKELN